MRNLRALKTQYNKEKKIYDETIRRGYEKLTPSAKKTFAWSVFPNFELWVNTWAMDVKDEFNNT